MLIWIKFNLCLGPYFLAEDSLFNVNININGEGEGEGG